MKRAKKQTRRPEPPKRRMDTLKIEGTQVTVTSPEGKTAGMSLEALIGKIAPPRMDTRGAVLPDGVKAVLSRGSLTILVHQTPPGVHNLRWIANDSTENFGPGTKYRQVRIALPYLIVLAVFGPGEKGELQLTGRNECFFRTEPLASVDDELLYPALLNISKFPNPDGHPLAWICTEKLQRAKLAREPDINKRIQSGVEALLQCLLATGFNRSSEHHEGNSWFTESCKADSRIATVEAWEKATDEDPLFVFDVPWLKTNHTVRQVAERTFDHLNATGPTIKTSSDLARIVFNQNNGNGSETKRDVLSLFMQLGI
jgi:hypothetical protein